MGADAVTHLSTLLVSGYLVMQRSDLAQWEADPESFVNAEVNEEGLRVRPSAENLFSTLMQQRRDVVSVCTIQMLEQVCPCMYLWLFLYFCVASCTSL